MFLLAKKYSIFDVVILANIFEIARLSLKAAVQLNT